MLGTDCIAIGYEGVDADPKEYYREVQVTRLHEAEGAMTTLPKATADDHEEV